MGFFILFTGIFYVALSDKLYSVKKIKSKNHLFINFFGWMIWSAGAVYSLFNYKLTHALILIIGSLITREVIGLLKD